MAQSRIESDLLVSGNVACNTLNVTSASITNAMVSATAAIEATKVVHQFPVYMDIDVFTAITAKDRVVHIVRGATATVIGFECAIVVAAVGVWTATVDLKKGNVASGFTTILSAVITLTSATVIRTATAATIASPNLLDGDILYVDVEITNAGGTAATGLVVTTFLREVT